MAYEKFNAVTKFNKGTSKDEWGNFNYWGYKTPDGIIRARLYAPDSDGISLLAVRKFEIQPNSWRRKITFDDAINIGDVFVRISDATKGLTSDEALKQVNSIIEIHNDYFDAHVGRKVRTKGYGGEYNTAASVVTGVSFSINHNDETLVTLYGDRWSQNTDQVIDYTDDFAKQLVVDELAKMQEKVKESQLFIDRCVSAHSNGQRIRRDKTGYGCNEGFIDNGVANTLVDLVNSLVSGTVEA